MRKISKRWRLEDVLLDELIDDVEKEGHIPNNSIDDLLSNTTGFADETHVSVEKNQERGEDDNQPNLLSKEY